LRAWQSVQIRLELSSHQSNQFGGLRLIELIE
jgi:hypothetical protein